MKDTIKIEELSDIQKKICVSVDPDVVNQKIDEFFKSAKKEARIPGFRKGQAPVKLLKQRFKAKALGTVAQMLIAEYYQKAIKDHSLSPVSNPTFENIEEKEFPGEFGDDDSFSVNMTIEVMPEIDPVGYENIVVEPLEHDFDSLMADKLREYQEKFAEREQITDGAAQEGDTVVLDFVGFIDGEQFEGGASEGFTIDNLGSDTLIPGFEQQVIGLKAGDQEYTISVKFPDEYNTEHLAGKDASFVIKVHNIIRKNLAEIDNDLALMSGFLNVDEMMESVKEEVNKAIENFNYKDAESKIVGKLLEDNIFSIPKTMISKELDNLLAQNNLKNAGDNIMKKVFSMAENNVRKNIVLNAIYEKENDIDLPLEELSEALEEQAKANDVEKDDMVSALYNMGRMEEFIGNLRGKKVIEHIMSLNESKE